MEPEPISVLKRPNTVFLQEIWAMYVPKSMITGNRFRYQLDYTSSEESRHYYEQLQRSRFEIRPAACHCQVFSCNTVHVSDYPGSSQ